MRSYLHLYLEKYRATGINVPVGQTRYLCVVCFPTSPITPAPLLPRPPTPLHPPLPPLLPSFPAGNPHHHSSRPCFTRPPSADMPRYDLHSYHAQPSSAYQPALPPPERRKTNNAKTRFPSLTPAPGPFLQSGDTRAAEAVAHARKTWAPPALRTQAVTSYGAVPDLEVGCARGGQW